MELNIIPHLPPPSSFGRVKTVTAAFPIPHPPSAAGLFSSPNIMCPPLIPGIPLALNSILTLGGGQEHRGHADGLKFDILSVKDHLLAVARKCEEVVPVHVPRDPVDVALLLY